MGVPLRRSLRRVGGIFAHGAGTPWTLLLGSIIIVGATLAITALHAHANAARDGQLALQRLDALTNPVAQLARQDALVSSTDTEQSAAPAPTEDTVGAAQSALARYVDTATMGRIRVTIAAYQAGLSRLLSAIALGPNLQSLQATFTDLGPVVRDEQILLGRVDATLHDDAVQSERLATFGTAFIMVVTCISMAALFWRVERARRRAAIISARERTLAESEERYRTLVQDASDLTLILNVTGEILYASPSAERLFTPAPGEQPHRSVFTHVHPDDVEDLRTAFAKVVLKPGRHSAVEFRVSDAEGPWRTVEAVSNNALTNPRIGGIVVTCRDITVRKAQEQQLTRLAFHDTLTGLPNRALFLDRVGHALAARGRYQRGVTVLYLDLDNFKIINDSLGHEVGDTLLVEVADRLRGCVRSVDTVSRLGGDEFTVLLEDVGDEAAAVAVAEIIGLCVREAVDLAGRELVPSASIGIVVAGPEETPEGLLRKADLAMYQAKALGKAQHQVYAERLNAAVQERLQLETDLSRALEQGELRLVYQPILELVTERLTEMEALVRWDHPERGVISPTHFIPFAEETGLIVPLGRWVLREACRQAAVWQRRYDRRLVMSINLSARQLQDPGLVDEVTAILRETGVPPESIKLEITESALMADVALMSAKLQALKAMGLRLAIDDFGTGYSSLAYLQQLPVDTLKVDRSFVEGLGEGSRDVPIVRNIIALAKSLNLSVTGEGVETQAQLAQLRSLGCDRCQGFLLAEPLTPDAMSTLLATGGPAVGQQAA